MKICDRCKASPIVAIYASRMDGGEIDLCKECNEELKIFLQFEEVEQKSKRTKAKQ